MPTNINVLSWNVESLGDGKATQTGVVPPQQSEVIGFMSLVIQAAAADVVGIMEIKSGRGDLIMTWLLSTLNNARPGTAPFAYTWKGTLSSRQDGGTQEEALILWKDQANTLTLDAGGVPGPSSLPGVVDANALAGLFAQTGWDAAQQAQFFTALSQAGYVQQGKFKARSSLVNTRTWRVTPDAWNRIHTGATTQVTFTGATQPPTALSTAQAQALAQTLEQIDILRFVTYGDRSPFLANFLVGNPAKKLMVSLLHAPGPQDLDRMPAINNMALSLPMMAQVAQDSLLLMGDFNINDSRLASLRGRVYGRFTNAQNVFGFYPVTPQQLVSVFQPITGAPLYAPDLLSGVKTSLVKRFIDDASAPADARASTFDKFFFHGSTTAGHQMAPSSARVVDLVAVLAANQGVFVQPVAASALTFFRAFRGAAFLAKERDTLLKLQDKMTKAVARLQKLLDAILQKISDIKFNGGSVPQILKRRRDMAADKLMDASNLLAVINANIANLDVAIALVNNAGATTASGVGTALTFYRFAVSDHLPIVVQLTA